MATGYLRSDNPQLNREAIFIAVLSLFLTFSSTWVVIEDTVSLPLSEELSRRFLLITIYAIPSGLTGWVVWRTHVDRTNLVAIVLVTGVTVTGIFLSGSESLVLFSSFLFVSPAIVAGQADLGLVPAIALSYFPVGGFLLTVPFGRVGSLTLVDRLSAAILPGGVIAIVSAVVYLVANQNADEESLV